MFKTTSLIAVIVLLFAGNVSAQQAPVWITLNEDFFDSFLNAVFTNFEPPQFSIAAVDGIPNEAANSRFFGFTNSAATRDGSCGESIRILRENSGVRTAVRFRGGQVYVPLAFSGSYRAPLVGCLEFAGWAESNLAFEFERNAGRLIGRITVSNVVLDGTEGVGGTMVARMLQSSIDRRLNPIEILRLDNLSFNVPVQNGGSLRMKASDVRPEFGDRSLNVRINYTFEKN
ncbi:MAG: hypothetical protein IPM50_01935 [Acidobacteriota bacterium]|nr:MAG: hypothetical protein IPM50_01935 [Acidobacteriota bacterium]